MQIRKKCDPNTEFQCNLKCIPRSSANNGINDCENGSDENLLNLVCFEYEFKCQTKAKNIVYSRCISYDMIRDGKNDCLLNVDENHYIDNCTHENLFLCLDQSRCLPKKLVCNQVINCIDGSDEIEGCKYPSYFRQFESDKAYLKTWFVYFFKTTGEQFSKINGQSSKSMLKKAKKLFCSDYYLLNHASFLLRTSLG